MKMKASLSADTLICKKKYIVSMNNVAKAILDERQRRICF